MFKHSDWSVDAAKILSRRELATVLADLAKRSIIDTLLHASASLAAGFFDRVSAVALVIVPASLRVKMPKVDGGGSFALSVEFPISLMIPPPSNAA
jgi:hypothetical protein